MWMRSQDAWRRLDSMALCSPSGSQRYCRAFYHTLSGNSYYELEAQTAEKVEENVDELMTEYDTGLSELRIDLDAVYTALEVSGECGLRGVRCGRLERWLS